ncbi:ABC transporter permease [Rossellomorea vietnamensis]|uniref:ABC transporter permease n=1 Tax=Rossellomorea vietnamensis TaxID=218284 RepID=UPI001E28421D|nr:ABC transporter permease subunit [Rossellomorea vietnamensis]MCC5800804.1 ABC transporter permease subunit [Rossellomorea vietnamensis]
MGNFLYSEIYTTARQTSYYSFSILWIAVLTLLFLLQRSVPDMTLYTNMTGTVMNIAMYIIPLFMLIAGSFSVAAEKENGQWRLLCTYPFNTLSYVLGKMLGQFVSQAAIFTFSFGISILIALLTGGGITLKWAILLFLFSIVLMYAFTVIGFTVGAFVSTRWQALSMSVGIWFFLIMVWPVAWINVLSLVPYQWIGPLMKVTLFLNPAELLRVVYVIKLDGGAVFGQPYDKVVAFWESPFSVLTLGNYLVALTVICVLGSVIVLNRRKQV